MATYNRNALTMDAIEWAPFNRTTGAASNIDNVVALVGYAGIRYIGGELYWAGVVVQSGDNVGMTSEDVPLKLTDTEIDDQWTEA